MKVYGERGRIHPAAEDSMVEADFTLIMTTGSFLDDLQRAAWDTQNLLGARLGCVVFTPTLNQTRRINCPRCGVLVSCLVAPSRVLSEGCCPFWLWLLP